MPAVIANMVYVKKSSEEPVRKPMVERIEPRMHNLALIEPGFRNCMVFDRHLTQRLREEVDLAPMVRQHRAVWPHVIRPLTRLHGSRFRNRRHRTKFGAFLV